ncbi:MAG: hypothetical protein Q8868_09875, partial [Bacteroidota bacterium]|nr:hypothetical protein [Bacteroidota bacterium]
MKGRFLLPFSVILLFSIPQLFSQGFDYKELALKARKDLISGKSLSLDSVMKKPEIKLSHSQALEFIRKMCQPYLWKSVNDPLRSALEHLFCEASNPPYDSTEYLLRRFPYDSIGISWDKFYIWEPMRLSIPVDSLDKPDSADVAASDTLLKNSAKSLKDTTVMVIVDTLDTVTSSYSGFPFRYYRYPLQGDSIKAAVNQLLDYIEKRDSSIIHFTGSGGSEYPLWL